MVIPGNINKQATKNTHSSIVYMFIHSQIHLKTPVKEEEAVNSGGRGSVRKKGRKVKNDVMIDLNEIKHYVSLCVYMHVY